MAEQVILPRQGQSVETCLILKWRKQEGDPVQEGEVLVEVETDKAAFEVPSTASGTVLRLLHAEGEDVPVLSPLAIVGRPGEEVAPLAGPAPEQAQPPAGKQEPTPSARRVPISPRARRLAQRHGLEPAAVLAALAGRSGSGPQGRILERDVQAVLAEPGTAAAGENAPAAPAAAPGPVPAAAQPAPEWAGPVSETVVKGVRGLIAERMLASLQASAQYTLQGSADAEALLALRERLKNSPEELGLRGITVNDLVDYAAIRLLLRHPEMNATFDGTTLRSFQRVHLGVAVDTPRGLLVPVVRDAARLTPRALAAESARLRQACLAGTITPEELSGGTFTVTNLGPLGVEGFTPVLNYPQVAILGVGAMQLRPVQTDTGVGFRRFVSLSLTANHQIVDGAPAARFLRALGQALENIELLLVE